MRAVVSRCTSLFAASLSTYEISDIQNALSQWRKKWGRICYLYWVVPSGGVDAEEGERRATLRNFETLPRGPLQQVIRRSTAASRLLRHKITAI